MGNLGLLYNKEYFEFLSFKKDGTCSMDGNEAIDELLKEEIQENKSPKISQSNTFELYTLYPGLLSGSGYQHSVSGKEIEGEFQLGFFFDYTTGLPVIPASSVKGVLRYACEMRNGEYLIEKVKKIMGLKEEDSLENEDFFKPIIKNGKKFFSEFVYNVFEGKEILRNGNEIELDEKGKPITKGISIYKRDIFHDAFPIKSKGKLFGSDYITHHKNPLQNPNPVQFLRVQPEVTYQFQFDLKDTNGLTAKQKAEIFKEIILDLGLGAKTNVGYGQFDEM